MKAEEGVFSVLSHIVVARDADGALGIEDILSVDRDIVFAPTEEKVPAFGYTAEAIWLRLDLENPRAEHIIVMLELPLARLCRINWFVIHEGRVLKEVTGGIRSRNGDSVRTRFTTLAVRMPPGEVRTVYLRVESDTAIWLPVKAFDSLDYMSYIARRDFLDYGFAGFGVAMFLLAFFNGLFLKRRLYLLLSLLVVFFIGYHLIFKGYYQWLGGPFPLWVNRQFMLAIGMAAHWSLFRFSLLYVESESGRGTNPVFRWMSWLFGAGAVALCIIPFHSGVWLLLALLALCYASGTSLALRHTRRSGLWYNYLFSAVWLFALLMTALMMAQFIWLMHIMIEPINLQRVMVPLVFAMFFTVLSAQHHQEQVNSSLMEQMKRAAAEAQLQALRYQLNPHFLFNTLNSIEALSHEAPERIPSVIGRLAGFLRSRIHPASSGMIALRLELESVRAYLDIEKVRFEEQLQVSVETDEGVLAHPVPDMILQPLVENAVKHGMTEKGALKLKVFAGREGDDLAIRVEHNGEIVEHESSDGVGIKNLSSRLLYCYKGRASFRIREERGSVIAEIRLPYRENTT